MPEPLTAKDIVLLYEGLLGRTPAGAEIEIQRAAAPSAAALAQVILASEEYALRRAQAPDPAVAVTQDPAGPLSPVTDWAAAFPPPAVPWSAEYLERHRALVSAALDDAVLCAAIAGDGPLPERYAAGYDERTVEYPWLFGRGPAGRVLDAGSTLNHPHILDRALPLVDDLTIVTLAPEAQAFPSRGISYVFADLRELPFRDHHFDLVVSLSTLEHVGKDNTTYGARSDAAAPARDPDAELARAASELRRVTRPGGRILLTVPYGRREDHGWLRQLDAEDLDRLIAAFGGSRHAVSLFDCSRDGWRRTTAAAAAGLRFHDATVAPPADDGAAAARGVACVAIDV